MVRLPPLEQCGRCGKHLTGPAEFILHDCPEWQEDVEERPIESVFERWKDTEYEPIDRFDAL